MKKLFRLVNPLMVALSKTPMHWFFSHQILVLNFNGRRSGKPYAIPVSYMRGDKAHGRQLLCMTDAAGLWWRNLLEPSAITVTCRGEQKQACVHVIEDDLQAITAALEGFCRNSFASAFFAGVSRSGGEPDRHQLTEAAKRHVLIDLTMIE